MLKKIKQFFDKKDRFAKLLGFDIVEIGEGYAKVEAEIKEEHLNAADVIHGGYLILHFIKLVLVEKFMPKQKR